MSSAAANAHERSSVSESCAMICARKPALATVVRSLAPLLEAKEKVQKEFVTLAFAQHEKGPVTLFAKEASPLILASPVLFLALPSPDATRIASGTPVLAGTDTSWMVPLFSLSARYLLPYLTSFTPLQKGVAACFSGVESEGLSVSRLIEAYLISDDKTLRCLAEENSVDVSVLLFFTQQVLGPVIGSYAEYLDELHEISWGEGYCPICGGLPSVGMLGRKDPEQSEFLAGGGGKKYLHCSLCSHEWRFQRGKCPSCGNNSAGAIEYFHSPDTPWERIEFCKTCNCYVNTLDLRATTENLDINAAALGMMHLDIYAAEKGLFPMAPQVWNTFGG